MLLPHQMISFLQANNKKEVVFVTCVVHHVSSLYSPYLKTDQSLCLLKTGLLRKTKEDSWVNDYKHRNKLASYSVSFIIIRPAVVLRTDCRTTLDGPSFIGIKTA